MKILSKILSLPVDLLLLTWDAVRITLDRSAYSGTRPERDQLCVHCKNMDCGYQPRDLPPGIKRYRNRWIGCLLQPCIRKDPSRQKGRLHVCVQDGGFVRYSRWITLLAFGLVGMWGFLVCCAFYRFL